MSQALDLDVMRMTTGERAQEVMRLRKILKTWADETPDCWIGRDYKDAKLRKYAAELKGTSWSR